MSAIRGGNDLAVDLRSSPRHGGAATWLNTTASNLANAGSVAGSAAAPISEEPLFVTAWRRRWAPAHGGCRTHRNTCRLETRHDPSHPLADANGDVFIAAVMPTRSLSRWSDSASANNVEVLQPPSRCCSIRCG
jgi:flagellar basal-body rod protein FlgC